MVSAKPRALVTRRDALKLIGLMAAVPLAQACTQLTGGSGASTKKGGGITIGEVISLTGNAAGYGVPYSQGLKLAVEELNAKGGIEGIGPITIVEEDAASDPQTAVNATNKLLTRDKVPLIIGSDTSATTLAMVPVTDKAKVPLINTASSSPAITNQGSKYIFRTQVQSSVSAQDIAAYAVNDLKGQRVGVLADTGEYAKAASAEFVKKLKELNKEAVVNETWTPKDKNFQAQLLKVQQANADVMGIFGYYEEMALLMQQARQLGLQFIPVSTDVMAAPEYMELGGPAVNGSIFTTLFTPVDTAPAVQDFVKRYQARWNMLPDNLSAFGDDAIKIAADAIKRAGSTDPEKIRDALAKTDNLETLTGKIKFTETGDAPRGFLKVKIVDGKHTVAARPA